MKPCAYLPCAFLLAASLPAAAQELGRLFFTPERRQALDRQREFKPDIPEPRESEKIEADPVLTIDGVVIRGDGKSTIWIDGIAQDGGGAVIPSRANPGRITVYGEGGTDTQASVGNTVDRSTGETIDLLGGGRIGIRPAPR